MEAPDKLYQMMRDSIRAELEDEMSKQAEAEAAASHDPKRLSFLPEGYEHLVLSVPVADDVMDAYNRYQLAWMLEHGRTLNEYRDILAEHIWESLNPTFGYVKLDNVVDAMREAENAFELDTGFDGEVFACFNEWYDADWSDAPAHEAADEFDPSRLQVDGDRTMQQIFESLSLDTREDDPVIEGADKTAEDVAEDGDGGADGAVEASDDRDGGTFPDDGEDGGDEGGPAYKTVEDDADDGTDPGDGPVPIPEPEPESEGEPEAEDAESGGGPDDGAGADVPAEDGEDTAEDEVVTDSEPEPELEPEAGAENGDDTVSEDGTAEPEDDGSAGDEDEGDAPPPRPAQETVDQRVPSIVTSEPKLVENPPQEHDDELIDEIMHVGTKDLVDDRLVRKSKELVDNGQPSHPVIPAGSSKSFFDKRKR